METTSLRSRDLRDVLLVVLPFENAGNHFWFWGDALLIVKDGSMSGRVGEESEAVICTCDIHRLDTMNIFAAVGSSLTVLSLSCRPEESPATLSLKDYAANRRKTCSVSQAKKAIARRVYARTQGRQSGRRLPLGQTTWCPAAQRGCSSFSCSLRSASQSRRSVSASRSSA
jgi:hypothetical protein